MREGKLEVKHKLQKGLVVVDEQFIIIQWNEGMERMFKVSSAKALQQPIQKILPEVTSALKNTNDHHQKSFVHQSEKELLAYEATIHVISEPKSQKFYIFIKPDVPMVTSQPKSLLQMVLDTIPQRIFWKDRNFRYLGGNESFLKDAGFDQIDELIGKTDFECSWMDNAGSYRQDDISILNTGRGISDIEQVQKRADGSVAWLRTSKLPIFDDLGKIVGIFGTYEDITDKKMADIIIKDSEAKYRELVNFLPQTIFEINRQGNLIFVNSSGLKAFGYQPDDLEKRHISVTDIMVPEERDLALQSIRAVLSNQESGRQEFTALRKDGTTFPMIVSTSRILKNGEVKGLRGIVFDLTEVKQAQSKIEAERCKLDALLNSMPDAVYIFDADGKYHEVLSSNKELLTMPVEELEGKYLKDFFSQSQTETFLQIIRKTIREKRSNSYQYPLRYPDGQLKWFEGRTSYFYDQDIAQDLVIWSSRDITQLIQFQEQLEASKENLSITLESIGDAVIATDQKGVVVRINQIAEEITGWSKQEAMGKSVKTIFRLRNSLNGKELENPVEQVLKIKQILALNNHTEIIRKDGTSCQIADSVAPILKKDGTLLGTILVFHDVTEKYKKERELVKNENRLKRAQKVAHVGDWEHKIGTDRLCASEEAFRILGMIREYPCMSLETAYANIHPEDLPMVRKAMEALVDKKSGYDVVYRIYRHNDQALRYVRSIAEIMYDHGREKILGTIQDITASRLAEDELKTRNTELNNFVYRVSHDLKAPLSSVKGLINLQRMENHEVQYLDLIDKSINKLDHFIRDILSHSRNLNTKLTLEEIDFQEIINQCMEELAYLKNYEGIIKRVEITGTTYIGDKVRINEIFRNLLSNSIKYADLDKTEPYLDIKVVSDQKIVKISIEDNGLGIPKEFQTLIFDMFFRGHEYSEGSGIGLYIVKQAVEKLGGRISLESTPRQGSTFALELPNNF
ncbi:MAG: PAS domain S-box protein [Candidatus Cyclobacteriaceae bacterium M3_2C_046]